MRRFVVPGLFAISAVLSAQTPFFPLKDVRAGMHGVGRTVFTGNRIDEFQVEILGVLDNFGPKESLILARLSGGPLEHTGVMQGMSGSPVYIDGKLAGAVAMAFPFAKDPIAGIRPIEEMVRPADTARRGVAAPRSIALAADDLTRPLSRPRPVMAGDARMIDIATPVSFGGFSRATLDAFAPQLRALGLEPRQAISAGARIDPAAMGNPADLKPGSMISVQLLSGDFSVGADGTVTYIDGKRIYAFGHRFLDVGATVAAFRPLRSPHPASQPQHFVQALHRPRVDGHHQRRPRYRRLGRTRQAPRPLVPDIDQPCARGGKPVESYQMQMVNDPLLSPLLLQMAVFSAIDATERTVGAATIRVTGEIEFQNAPAPVQIDNMFSADNGSAMQVSLSTAVPLAYVMQSGFRTLDLKKVAIRVDAYDQKKQLSIDGVTVSKREARPGDKLQLNVLAGRRKRRRRRRARWTYNVPVGAEPGILYFTVADANTANLSDFRQILTSTPRSPSQVITTVNNLHPNTKAYVRVWRADPAYQLEGADLPDPPASVALILAGSQSSLAGITQTRNSKIGEMEIDGGDMVISGVKTVQVEIKE